MKQRDIKALLHFFHPVVFYRRFRLSAQLAGRLRRWEKRAPTDAEYKAIAAEVERRIP